MQAQKDGSGPLKCFTSMQNNIVFDNLGQDRSNLWMNLSTMIGGGGQ